MTGDVDGDAMLEATLPAAAVADVVADAAAVEALHGVAALFVLLAVAAAELPIAGMQPVAGPRSPPFGSPKCGLGMLPSLCHYCFSVLPPAAVVAQPFLRPE